MNCFIFQPAGQPLLGQGCTQEGEAGTNNKSGGNGHCAPPRNEAKYSQLSSH